MYIDGDFTDTAFRSAQETGKMLKNTKLIPVWRRIRDGRYYNQPTIDELDSGEMILCYRDFKISVIDLIRNLPYNDDK